jgi:hypothetical protein
MPRRNEPRKNEPRKSGRGGGGARQAAGSSKSAKSGKASQEVRSVRLPHWRADGSPKVRYRTEAEAHKAGFGYRLEHGTDLHAYECEYCGGWHLGANDK